MIFRSPIALIIFCLHLAGTCSANLDSLKQLLKPGQPDTSRCKLLSQLIELEEDINVWPVYNEELLQICEQYLAKSQSKDPMRSFYLKHKADAYNNIGYLANLQGNIGKAVDFFTKSLRIQEELGDKKGMAAALINLGYIYNQQGNKATALKYYSLSLKLLEQIGDRNATAITYNNIALIYQQEGSIAKAMEYYGKSIAILEAIGDTKVLVSTLNNLGYIYKDQGDIPKALDYFSRSLKIHERSGDKSAAGYLLNNLALIYKEQTDTAKALEYMNRSLKLRQEAGDKKGIAISLNNLGLIYCDQGKIAMARQCFLKSLSICETIGDKHELAYSMNNLGVLNKRLKNLPEAVSWYRQSAKLFEQISDKKGWAMSLNNIADLQLQMGNTAEAKTFAEHSLVLAQELGFPEYIQYASATLSRIFAKTNNWKAAYEMHTLFKRMSDSLSSEQNKKASMQRAFQYEYEKKAAEDRVRTEEERKVHAAELKQERIRRIALFAGLILVIAFSIVILNRFRITKKQKNIIEAQKRQVDSAYDKLNEKNKEVLDSIRYAQKIQNSLLPREKYISAVVDKIRQRTTNS